MEESIMKSTGVDKISLKRGEIFTTLSPSYILYSPEIISFLIGNYLENNHSKSGGQYNLHF